MAPAGRDDEAPSGWAYREGAGMDDEHKPAETDDPEPADPAPRGHGHYWSDDYWGDSVSGPGVRLPGPSRPERTGGG